MKGKIDLSESIKKWCEKNIITKLEPGIAKNATLDGTVCSGRFNARALSQTVGIDRNLNEVSQRNLKNSKLRKKHRDRTKKLKGKPATEKQKAFMDDLGIKYSKNVSRRRAFGMIGQTLGAERELAQAIKERMARDLK